MSTTEKVLFAFDFDHTILNENTDLYIVKMVPGGSLPEEIQALYTKDNWTDYMGEVFKYLHKLGYGPTEMNTFMGNMIFAPGMEELITTLKTFNSVDQIIISDSNSIFIDTILKRLKLRDCFEAVFTNPAQFDSNGLLTIDYYHHQDWCSMSTKNLCKGHILTEFVKDKKLSGIEYNKIVYVGDGSNDLCPAARLTSDDYLFIRKGYRLDNLLQKPDQKSKVKAKCHSYEDGMEIFQHCESFLA